VIRDGEAVDLAVETERGTAAERPRDLGDNRHLGAASGGEDRRVDRIGQDAERL